MPSPVIELIHKLARHSDNAELDKPVYLRNSLGIHLLADCEKFSIGYQNVNAADLIGRVRGDNQSGYITWRDLALTIHGNTKIYSGAPFQNTRWGFGFFRYFNSSLKGKKFPSHNSIEELKFESFGKAIFCTIGNHRVVAGKVWLLSRRNRLKNPLNSYFKNVNVTKQTINDQVKEVLNLAIRQNSTVSVGKLWNIQLSNYYVLFLRISSPKSKQFFIIDRDYKVLSPRAWERLFLSFGYYILRLNPIKIKWRSEIPIPVLKLLVA